MYEYVRRQQELQPNVFATKTFQWMDGGLRDSHWARLYSRNAAADPLLHPSAGLFAGMRVPSKPGTFGALQRSAAGLTPHRALFAFKRHRQSSDTAANRPLSGTTGAFWPRRRGFTVPANSQPPVLAEVDVPAKDQVALQRGRGATVAVDYSGAGTVNGPGSVDIPDAGPPAEAGGPISATIMPQQRTAAAPAAQAAAASGNIESDGASSPPPFPPLPSAAPLAPPPQLQSSFSPPLSPRPRTICHRARLLMHRVRNKAASDDHTYEKQPPSGPSASRAQPARAAPPPPSHTIASVLCPSPRPTPGSPDSAQHGSRLAAPQPLARPRPGARSPRVLPRSPLATPMTVLAADPSEDEATGPSSSDEEGRSCQVCLRFKSIEWIVSCDAGHPLCFGCVQVHVKRLLANTAACTVVCPSGSCAAGISNKHLRACLPPHRLQRLLANRCHSNRTSGLLKRSLSMCTRWKSTDSGGKASFANSSDEGFDAPLIAVTSPGGATAAEDSAHTRRAGALTIVAAPQEHNAAVKAGHLGPNQPNQPGVAAQQQRLSTSMPVLYRESGASSSSDTSGPILSELTTVGPASINSVVVAASVAADSALTLSPESVGSRLRRVPKAREQLGLSTSAYDGPIPRPHKPHNGASSGSDRPAFIHSMYESGTASPHPQAPSPVSSGSPLSWQPPERLCAQLPSTLRTPPQPPAVPLPLPPAFRASATWITPGQRYSGYTENMLLNATLFETIRRRAPSDGEDSDGSVVEYPIHPRSGVSGQRLPIQGTLPGSAAGSNAATTADNANDDDDSAGVYIPTWRRPTTARQPQPLWADAQYGSQSGLLCEAAELNFDLYETLHRRR
ncbi:hypothetical protein GGF46_000591 [Coemansia sp. RSA 552]|nr:hypothetical protein GGF46_000591 [Coemansia sp. RSA 552]